jgi:kinesin family member 21
MYPRANNNAVIQSEGMKLQIGNKEFSFDRVFDTESSQDEVFETCSRNLILGCLQGYNATILAYGQTGSGKTFTMGTGSTIGLSVDQIGIVPRVFDFIFQELDIKRR